MYDMTPDAQLLCCPRCRGVLRLRADAAFCTRPDCLYHMQGFPRVANGQLVLIDFEDSIFPRKNYAPAASVSVLKRDVRTSGPLFWLRELALAVDSKVSPANARIVLEELRRLSDRPRLLILGGGALGSGLDVVVGDSSVDVVTVDVYPSSNTDLLADGHALPFRDAGFDGVWIQAVLEHVLEPHRVVGEIHRVLKPKGIVYAETPFMCAVHEGAYDFTRFSASGHRWLFRRFAQIGAGTLGGAATTLVWAIRYFWRAFGIGEKAAIALTLPFFWIRYLDRFTNERKSADAGYAFWFLGRKILDGKACPSAMPTYYDRFPPRASEVVNAVRQRATEFGDQKVVHPHQLGLSLRAKLAAAIFDVANKLLLFRVNRDRRLTPPAHHPSDLNAEEADPRLPVVCFDSTKARHR
jgi:SAM-dependent methyltransferase